MWLFHFNKLNSSLPKDAMCQVWLKLAQWFLRRRFFNFINVFLLFLNYFILEKGWALHLNKLEFPSPKDDLCQVWLKLAQRFWRLKMKKWKVYDDVNDNDGQRTNFDQKSSLEPWTLKRKNLQTNGRTNRQRTTALELSAQVS